MKFITRLLMTLLALLLVAFLTVLLITPDTVVDVLARLEQVVFAARVALVVIMYLVILSLLYLQVRSTPKAQSDTLSVNASGAIAAVTVDSVRERILKTIGEVPGVASVTAQLKSIRGKADIDLSVTTTDDKVNIPEKQKEINRALEQVIKKQLGIQMAGRPRVNIRLGTVKPVVPAPAAAVPLPVIAPPPPPAPIISPAAEIPFEEPKRSFFGGSSSSVEPITPAASFTTSQPEDDQMAFYAMLDDAKLDDETSDEVDKPADQ
ncbi:MAG: hypothetical protein H7X77_01355 [Anaerolineae bacterium]|nr:hypothetical protein [Anaerolineae bacterium]